MLELILESKIQTIIHNRSTKFYNSEIEIINKKYENEIHKMETDHENDVQRIKEENANKIESMKKECEDKVNHYLQQIEESSQNLENHRKELDEIKTSIEKERNEYENAIENLMRDRKQLENCNNVNKQLEDQITKLKEQIEEMKKHQEIQPISADPKPVQQIYVGRMVRVKNGAKVYGKQKVYDSWVFSSIFQVRELVRDRAVICYNGRVTGPINVNDLIPT